MTKKKKQKKQDPKPQMPPRHVVEAAMGHPTGDAPPADPAAQAEAMRRFGEAALKNPRGGPSGSAGSRATGVHTRPDAGSSPVDRAGGIGKRFFPYTPRCPSHIRL